MYEFKVYLNFGLWNHTGEPNMAITGVVIVAGGIGTRLRKNQPKALIKIGKYEMFIYPLQVFQKLRKEIGAISLVTPTGWGERFAQAIKKANLEKPYAIVDGGPRRQDSVRFGLRALPDETEYVLIHDAARPFITTHQIKKLIELVKHDGAATVACKVRDTLRVGDEHSDTITLGKTVERENLWALGTPQGFNFYEILKAHERAQKRQITVTDDTQLIPKGRKISILEVDMLNFKVTYPEDLEFAEAFIPIWERRFTKF